MSQKTKVTSEKRKVSPERRSEIARAAARARWGHKQTPTSAPFRILRTLADIENFCRLLAMAGSLPPDLYRGASDEVAAARALHIVQLGLEVGLQPGQALASIAVRRGNVLIKGDAMLALVLSSGKAHHVKEYTDGGDMYNSDGILNVSFTHVCETHRVGDDGPRFTRFSVQDAITAELWGKPGPWTTHPGRMLMHKPRAFRLRDSYPDILKGLAHSVEEMEGEVQRTRYDTDIAPHAAAEKLGGILDERMLHNTLTGNTGGKPK